MLRIQGPGRLARMVHRLAAATAMLACFCSAAPGAATTQPSWQAAYQDEEATGKDVIALWHFDADAPLKDSSGKGHDLSLAAIGSSFVPDGKFGGALRVSIGPRLVDEQHGVTIADRDDLSPGGPFTIEMWIQPDAQLQTANTAFLIDKKGYPYKSDDPHANDDYLLWLVNNSNNEFYLEAHLGYGKDSDIMRSRLIKLRAGQWYHIAFSYDGRGGSRLSLDGTTIGQFQHEGRGAISNGVYQLAIGDRVMGIHAPFPGKIDEVRISNKVVNITTGNILINIDKSRTAFYRMEKDAALRLEVLNDTGRLIQGASVTLSADGMVSKTVPLPELTPGGSAAINLPVDAQSQVGPYAAAIRIMDDKGQPVSAPTGIHLTLVGRPIPHQMPVVMWEFPQNLQDLKDIGFTGTLVDLPLVYREVWETGVPNNPDTDPRWQYARKRLDDLLKLGLFGAPSLAPGSWVGEIKEFGRVQRNGSPYPHPAVDGLYDRVQAFCRNFGATVAKALGDMPGFQAALIDSEVRDHTQLSFNDIDKEAYRKFGGHEIPADISNTHGVLYQSLSGFPDDRIIPDDHPILAYYRWFWKQGDGWPVLYSQENEGIHSTGQKGLWTWHDPAIRVPSLWGSGGNVDYLSQWTYSYPSPLKIDMACDSLFAMARGRPGQQVMNMIQTIWYRSETAPAAENGQDQRIRLADWEKQQPDAQFISIAPDHLSEGTWLELAHPIKGIMYHGWGSLVKETNFPVYRMTNPRTKDRLTEILHTVVMPLGPTLMQVPDPPSEVAFLESFSSQMLAGRGTYGWSLSEPYAIIRHAALQPQIIYEETIEKFGLAQYKVLVLADCDVLTRSVADAILKFQLQGGIIIGDDHLAPGIQPDILIQNAVQTGKADKDKAAILASAGRLRQDLDRYFTRACDSSNPEVIVRLRRYGTSDYFFAVNDHRTFGDYVGQHGLVMEKGLPARSTLMLNRAGGAVYDLTESRLVDGVRKEAGRLTFSSDFGPGQGRLFMVTSRPIAAVRIKMPEKARAGDSVRVEVAVIDDAGHVLDAVVPLHIRITDAGGKEVEFSGYYGARDGKTEVNLDLPSNAPDGNWTIQARELASGQSSQMELKISQPN